VNVLFATCKTHVRMWTRLCYESLWLVIQICTRNCSENSQY